MINATDEKVQQILKDWHEAGRENFERQYGMNYDGPAYAKTAKEKTKYINLDDGSSGAFMIERATGDIFRIKSKYGVPNRKKFMGNVETISGALLASGRWY